MLEMIVSPQAAVPEPAALPGKTTERKGDLSFQKVLSQKTGRDKKPMPEEDGQTMAAAAMAMLNPQQPVLQTPPESDALPEVVVGGPGTALTGTDAMEATLIGQLPAAAVEVSGGQEQPQQVPAAEFSALVRQALEAGDGAVHAEAPTAVETGQTPVPAAADGDEPHPMVQMPAARPAGETGRPVLEQAVPAEAEATSIRQDAALTGKSSVDEADAGLKQPNPAATPEPSGPALQEKRETAKTVEFDVLSGTQAVNRPLGQASEAFGTAEAAQPQAAAVIEQTFEKLRAAVDRGSTELTFSLHPKDMGEISVRLNYSAEGLQVTLQPHSTNTGKLMESQLHQLKQALVDSGINLSSLNVSSGNQGGAGGFAFANPQTAKPASWNAFSGPAAEMPVDQPAQEYRRSSSSQLDYLI